MTFPPLHFDADHVPVGDSVPYCLGLSWTTVKKRNQYDKYISLRGQEPCAEYTRGNSQWEDDYPKHGVNFKLWKQIAQKGDSSCSGGIYISSSDNCYRYEIATNVCVMAKFSHDAERNTYSWVYTGGCFTDNQPVWYEALSPYETARFQELKFQVRID